MRDLTVPKETPISWAISGCVKPLKYESFNTVNCLGGSFCMALPNSCFSSVCEADVAMSILSSMGCTSKVTSMLAVSFLLLRDLYRSTLRFRTNTISQLVSLPFCGLNDLGFFQRAVKASCTTSSASHLSCRIWKDSENNLAPMESYSSARAVPSPAVILSQTFCSFIFKFRHSYHNHESMSIDRNLFEHA